MSAIAVTARPQSPFWRRLMRLQHPYRDPSGDRRLVSGVLDRNQDLGESFNYFAAEAGQNDIAIFLGYFLGVVGFLIGLGFLNYPVRRMLGYPPTLAEKESVETHGALRYFSLSTDHKVVGMQYLVGIGFFFGVGGLNAMFIRTELLSPHHHVFGANQYLTLVGMHGTMMMGMMTSSVLGPFANYFVPIMSGSRRMAFPRIEAFTFWLLMAAGVILITTLAWGGFQTGWTGYQPLGRPGHRGVRRLHRVLHPRGHLHVPARPQHPRHGGHDARAGYDLVAPADFRLGHGRDSVFDGAGGADAGGRADDGHDGQDHPDGLLHPGLRRQQLLMAEPVLVLRPSGGLHRRAARLRGRVGAPARVHAKTALGIPRSPSPGSLGVTFLSFFVWQHHLFVSGINADLRPFYMLSTELISIPTGFIFLSAMGTLWRGRIRFTVPMWFCIGWAFNFLFGGISGVFLSDVPSDVLTHGSFFSMAHFHYTIMGGLVFTFFAAIYFWVPKMTGLRFNEFLSKLHFWTLFVAFNATFGPLFAVGWLGMPRRVVTYPFGLQTLNDVVSIAAYCIGVSMLIFLANVVWSLVIKREPAVANPWNSKSIEFQLPSPVPVHDFDRIPVFDADPYPYGEPVPAVPAFASGGGQV